MTARCGDEAFRAAAQREQTRPGSKNYLPLAPEWTKLSRILA
jgi:hypothetical protein